jgi:hypothetical protein
VALGSQLISSPPADRYGSAASTTRPLEPGFIPLGKPARLTIVSYYPNAATLNVTGYDESEERFRRWGARGTVEAYEAAHADWLQTMPRWPFYQKWIHEIITTLGVATEELAWLPLVKLPCLPEAPPLGEMVRLDRSILRQQLELLRPSIIWVQSQEVFENAGGLITEIQPRYVIQKLYKTKTSATSPETNGIIRALRRYLAETAHPTQ